MDNGSNHCICSLDCSSPQLHVFEQKWHESDPAGTGVLTICPGAYLTGGQFTLPSDTNYDSIADIFVHQYRNNVCGPNCFSREPHRNTNEDKYHNVCFGLDIMEKYVGENWWEGLWPAEYYWGKGEDYEWDESWDEEYKQELAEAYVNGVTKRKFDASKEINANAPAVEGETEADEGAQDKGWVIGDHKEPVHVWGNEWPADDAELEQYKSGW